MQLSSKHWQYLAIGFVLLLTALVTLPNINTGSIHNSDDAVYAQVMRQVSQGDIFPLKYGENKFRAKPPLAFWIGGFFVSVFGDQDASYRLLSILSFWLLIGLSAWMMAKRAGLFAGFLVSILLLGSPMTVLLARRPMLDMPLTAIIVALLWTASSLGKKWWVFWILAALGWWIKGPAILPIIGACMIGFLLFHRGTFSNASFWYSSSIFPSAILLLHLLQSQPHDPVSKTALGAAKGQALVFAPPASIYLDALWIDSPFFWAFPVVLLWLLWNWLRRKENAPDSTSIFFLLGALLWFLALGLFKTRLPHYLLPGVVLSLIFVSSFLSIKFQKPILRTLTLLLGLAQILWANTPQYSSKSFDIDPARATKILAQKITQLVPPDQKICTIDLYPAGVTFYAGRIAHGYFTSERAYEAHRRLSELRGTVHRLDPTNIETALADRCGGLAIAPERWWMETPTKLSSIRAEPPLQILQMEEKL